ncbi:MAG: hypothetical protein LBJ38_00045 [Oscillospiraceae bacterium]|jgi:hypothetical protein|nr:hypothetical protein [Oscillospiraceae bacterium]
MACAETKKLLSPSKILADTKRHQAATWQSYVEVVSITAQAFTAQTLARNKTATDGYWSELRQLVATAATPYRAQTSARDKTPSTEPGSYLAELR